MGGAGSRGWWVGQGPTKARRGPHPHPRVSLSTPLPGSTTESATAAQNTVRCALCVGPLDRPRALLLGGGLQPCDQPPHRGWADNLRLTNGVRGPFLLIFTPSHCQGMTIWGSST